MEKVVSLKKQWGDQEGDQEADQEASQVVNELEKETSETDETDKIDEAINVNDPPIEVPEESSETGLEPDFQVEGLSMDDPLPLDDSSEAVVLEDGSLEPGDCNAKLDLAEAYIEIEDIAGACKLLNDVIEQGDAAQQKKQKRS